MRSNDNHDDRDLRDRFAVLRREEEAQAPRFALPLRVPVAPRGRWSAPRLVGVTVSLVAMVVAVFWLGIVAPKPPRNGVAVASITEWTAPTDFLLQTPGGELLRTVPAVGVWHGYTDASRNSGKHSPATKQVLP
jgi:hypothetical protein